MSYTSWHNYGYGIRVDDIVCSDVERLEQLLTTAPDFSAKLHGWLSETGINEPVWEDYMEYDQDFCLGLATILKEVIEETEGIQRPPVMTTILLLICCISRAILGN